MSKRFTDSEKWGDPWFRNLPLKYKLLWLYLTDVCDNAGIWKVDLEMASFKISEPLDHKEALKQMNGDRVNGERRVLELNEGRYWFVTGFYNFQWGKNRKNSILINVIKGIKNHRFSDEILKYLPTLNGGLAEGYPTLGIGIGKGKGKGKTIRDEHFQELWALYPSKIGKKKAETHFYATVETEEAFECMKKALENYKRSDRVKHNFIQNASTWFNNWEDWAENPITNEGEEQKIRSKTKNVDKHLERILDGSTTNA